MDIFHLREYIFIQAHFLQKCNLHINKEAQNALIGQRLSIIAKYRIQAFNIKTI